MVTARSPHYSEGKSVQDKLSHLGYWNLDIITLPQRPFNRDCALVKGNGENNGATSQLLCTHCAVMCYDVLRDEGDDWVWRDVCVSRHL